MPPCGSDATGRPLNELVNTYIHCRGQGLSEYDTVSEGIYVSKVQGLTLVEYCTARKYHCKQNHDQPCTNCMSMIQAAQIIVDRGIVPVSTIFKQVFPTITYTSSNAKRHLLQMPAVAFQIKKQKGQSELYLMEKVNGVNYERLAYFFTENIQKVVREHGITKEELKKLLTLTQNERERELIKYAVYKTSGATPSEARRWLGIENMRSRAARIESSIQEVQEIYEAVDMLASSQDKAVLDTLGIESTSSSSSESSDEETDRSDCDSLGDSSETMLDHSLLTQALIESNFNWFEFHENVECMMEHSDSKDISKNLDEFFLQIPHMGFSQSQIEHAVQSHRK